ncbi:MAG: universal stress protein, partial [Bdellovibrionota bacterium]
KYLALAINFAKEFSAKLVIIHRLEVPPVLAMDWVGFAAASEMESMREAILENEVVKQGQGQAFLSEAKAQGVEAEFLLERGMTPLSQSIVTIAMRIKADIIAVAAQDHGLTQKILGSTSREVLQLSPRPVLILPGRI